VNSLSILQAEDARYLRLHLDRRPNWRNSTEQDVLDARQQVAAVESKLLLFKPIWTYGVQLSGTVANSNIEIIQTFQNKYLGIIVNAPWYVTNDILHHDLNIPYIRDEIKKLSQRYADRLEEHPNTLAINLMSNAEISRGLKRKLPQDLYI